MIRNKNNFPFKFLPNLSSDTSNFLIALFTRTAAGACTKQGERI